MNSSTWYKGTVLQGDKTGRIIGYPTVNISPSIIPLGFVTGVYACKVNILDTIYNGALFYGARLVKDETNTVLEIHIIGFNGSLYDKEIAFKIGAFIRENMKFSSMVDLQYQIQKDLEKIAALHNN